MNHESSKAKRLNALYPNLGKLYDMRVDDELSNIAKYEQEIVELSDLAQSEFNEIERESAVSDFYDFSNDSLDELDDIHSTIRDYFSEQDFDDSQFSDFPVRDSFNEYFNKLKETTEKIKKDIGNYSKNGDSNPDKKPNKLYGYDLEGYIKKMFKRKKDF